jgi:hypothetical protein
MASGSFRRGRDVAVVTSLAAAIAAAVAVTGPGCGQLLGLDGYEPATCNDGVKSGDESDVDCGGPACGGCADYRVCRSPADCQSAVCAAGQCVVAACDDTVKNGVETDVDCGGGACARCGDLELCAQMSDCESGICSEGKCAVPACDDAVANGTESDVDCGGGACGGCANEETCQAATDCVSGGCVNGTCGTWAKALGGTLYDGGTSIVVDSNGEIVVSGVFRDTVNFGGEDLISAGEGDIFLARYSREGAHLWSKRFGGPQEDNARISLDGNGDILLVGLGVEVSFGGVALGTPGERTILVAKLLGKSGAHIWSTGFSAPMSAGANGVSADATGDVYVCGGFDSAQFAAGGNPLIYKGGIDGYVAKFAGINGKHIWSRSFGGPDDDYASGVEPAPDGNIIVAGIFISPTVNFGGVDLHNYGGLGKADIFVAKLPGAVGVGELWSKDYGEDGSEGVVRLAVDSSGDIVVAGTINGAGNVGGFGIVSASTDGYVAKYSGNDGSHIWSSFIQGPEHDLVQNMGLDGEGNAFIIGHTQSDYVDFGGEPVANPGAPKYEVILAKYSSTSGGHLFSAAWGSGFDDFGFGVAINKATGNVVSTGAFASVMTVGGAQVESAGSADCFISSLGRLP